MNEIEDHPRFFYIPTSSWVRNYRAMKDEKLLECLQDFRGYEEHAGWYWHTNAIQRVVLHEGDIDVNAEACRNEARRRGLIAR